ncbi:hypothetical protein AMS68_001745 [Peltaster fructicola]|uniref:Sec1-like protein n=1 Tax=Peltaster fructicola TaxID=286661 RepID=A0A6H0XNN2_9PEZI|nr:hypothetical protein AMS68_001745 [Peltaster fructicola]
MAAQSAVKAIDTQAITEKARRDLLRLLETVRGKKNLVVERSLAGTIGLFVKFSTLQEYGVDKVFFLENHNVGPEQRNIIFLANGENTNTCRTVAEQIKLVRTESNTDHDFTVIWVPRRTSVSNIILEEHGVLGEVNVYDFPLYFIPLEADLLSLELATSFKHITLRKDPTSLFTAAKAIMMLQKQYGLFPRILGKGDNAKHFADLLQRMRSEDEVDAISDPNNTYLTSFGITPSSILDNLIVIDREIDLPTVMATQLTYEGLIEEVFSITNNSTEVESAIFGTTAPQQNPASPAPANATKRRIQLDSTDKLYPDLRNANFTAIGQKLNVVARRLQAEKQNFEQGDKSLSNMKSFAAKLPSYQAEQASARTHTALAEEIMKFTRADMFGRLLEIQQNLLAGADPTTYHEKLEEMIARNVPLKTVLRLLCLESCLSNGIRQRDLESFKRQIMTAYGFQHILTLANLERMGLLVPRESHKGYLNPIAGAAGSSATDWNAARRGLHLWVDEVAEADPIDIAYVFSGYAPLSVRLVQAILQKSHLQELSRAKSASATTQSGGTGWKGYEDVISRIRGATVDVVQKGRDADASAARKTLRGSKEGPKVNVVLFLGGVTYAEIAALRFVGEKVDGGRKLVIATTSILSGNRAIGAALEERRFCQ